MLKYESNFSLYIKALILQKNSLGHPYISSSKILYNFDCFCKNNYPLETNLTKEIAEEWAMKRSTENVNGLTRRISPIRQLAKFMIRSGSYAYIIPDGVPGKQIRFIPYMFSREDLAKFFKAADQLDYYDLAKIRHIVLPVMFRVMYTCGLRVGEIRGLLRNQFDSLEGTLVIEESKGPKDRLIYMAPDVCELLKKYDLLIEAIYPNRQHMFVTSRGTKISKTPFSNYFNLILDKASISSDIKKIRPYDLRHAYAVHRINKWMNTGQDFNKLLPYLSKHMGHTHFESTSYYIHLTSEFYPEMKERMRLIHQSVIPGDDYEIE